MVYQEGKHSEVTGLIKSVADSGLELQAVRAKSFVIRSIFLVSINGPSNPWLRFQRQFPQVR